MHDGDDNVDDDYDNMKEKHDKMPNDYVYRGNKGSFHFQGCMPRCLFFALSSSGNHHKITIISFDKVLSRA